MPPESVTFPEPSALVPVATFAESVPALTVVVPVRRLSAVSVSFPLPILVRAFAFAVRPVERISVLTPVTPILPPPVPSVTARAEAKLPAALRVAPLLIVTPLNASPRLLSALTMSVPPATAIGPNSVPLLSALKVSDPVLPAWSVSPAAPTITELIVAAALAVTTPVVIVN